MSDEAKAREVYHNDYTGEYTYFPDHDAFTLGLFIPNLTIDEAREFIEAAKTSSAYVPNWDPETKKAKVAFIKTCDALLATLPEKAAAVIAVAEEV